VPRKAPPERTLPAMAAPPARRWPPRRRAVCVDGIESCHKGGGRLAPGHRHPPPV